MSESTSGKTTATYVLASSIFALAIALVYFTVQIGTLSTQIPEILESVETTSQKIEPVVKEIGQVRDLIPPILTEVQKTRDQIPLILEEVRLTREQIPSVLSEVAKTRQQVPLILEEVKNTRQQIPAILDTANKASSAVVVAAAEMEKTRPLVPQVLDQVEKTRDAMPGIMDRAEDLIGQAKEAGREASKGAVTGVLTGIVTAPFDIIGNVGKKFIGISDEEGKNLTEEDIAMMTEAVRSLLPSSKPNSFKEWSNPESNHKGRVTLKSIDSFFEEDNGGECKEMLVQVWEGNKSVLKKLVTLCKEQNDEWVRRQ